MRHHIKIQNKQKYVKPMNYSYKLKIRNTQQSVKEEGGVRRIRTDHLDTLKKSSKKPLADNARIANYNHPQNQVMKPSKKATIIKSVLNKNTGNYSRLTTEPSERPQYMHHHRTATATDKLVTAKEVSRKSNVHTTANFKKKDTRDSSCKVSQPSKQRQQNFCQQGNGSSRYQVQKKVGSGTFGTVYKARDKKKLQIVAIKKVFQDKNYKNRELDILKILKHPNVLSMRDSFFTYENDKEYLNVVMDYYDCNLYEAIKKNSQKNPVPRLKFKVYAYQLFRSLLYLQSINIAHRDIKPQNVLVNEDTLRLVMCDFGSAKQLKEGEPNIAYICSRCYRAPELIFGNTQYSTQIDMWSTGCILAQMLTCHPLFQGDSNIDQLVEIIKVLGCPSNNEIMEMSPDYDINKFQLPRIGAKNWQKIFPTADYLGDEFIDLIKNVLCYSPHRRFTPVQALSHGFFDELRDQQTFQKLQIEYGLDDLFDYKTTRETPSVLFKQLIPLWY